MASGYESNHRDGSSSMDGRLEKNEREDIPETRRTVSRHDWRPGRRTENIELNIGRARSQEATGQSTTELPSPWGNLIRATSATKRKRTASAESSDLSQSPETSPDFTAPAPKRTRPIPSDWEPPLAIGASLGTGLSRLEEADRRVAQWEAILKHARETQPGTNLSGLERRVEEVRRERDGLDETDENTVPV